MAIRSNDKLRDSTTASRPGRKPYRTPSLHVYGSLARITDAVTFMGMLDGGDMIGMRRSGG